MSIFVSIAAYRDPQLEATIRDCIAKARRPEDLHFGICWQRGPEETLSLPEETHCRIIDVDWRESRGACWARAEIMRLWDGEDYFFQLDSHHRFAPDWDVKLIGYMRRTNSAKPILTTYGTPFTPGENEVLDAEPMRMNFDYFTPQAIALFRPGFIDNWRRLNRPLRARFISAHFLFTIGEFVREVPYDPELYFIGEEISLTIRAFTHGYDLFHPPEPIVWHEYTRAYRPKHWDDHVKEQNVEAEWHQRDAESLAKVQQFLTAPTIGPFACGAVRSFADYEAYAGLSFRHKRAQDYTNVSKNLRTHRCRPTGSRRCARGASSPPSTAPPFPSRHCAIRSFGTWALTMPMDRKFIARIWGTKSWNICWRAAVRKFSLSAGSNPTPNR